MKKAKKAQLEMIGLAVVVILISIGMLFVLNFVVTRKPAKTQSTFSEWETSQNMLTAMLTSVSRDCKSLDIGALLQDCANNYASRGSIECNFGVYSCMYVEAALAEMLPSTIDSWRYSYRFRAYITDPNSHIIPFDPHNKAFNPRNCTDLTEKESPGIQPIPLDVGTLTVILEICKQ